VPLIYTEVQAIKTLMQGGTMAQGGVNMQDLITLQNQHLSHLPNIAANTSSILAECQSILAATQSVATNLERVIKPQGTSPSYTMNISMR
jgi:hypothetical protein